MLGEVPGVRRAPIDAWRDKLNLLDIPALPSEELFIALAGERTTRTVQKYGVEWDHIRYWSPELDRILAHPDYRQQTRGHKSAQYEVRRDPYDLSQIYLYNHHANEVMVLPVVERWAKYTEGLSVHEHRLCREHETIREEQRGEPDALWKARAALIEAGMGHLRSGRRKKLELKLRRFLYGNRLQPRLSSIQCEAAREDATSPMTLSSIVEEPTFLSAKEVIRAQHADSGEPRQTQFDRPETVDDMEEILTLAAEVRSECRSDA
jgi:putative transposase